MTGSVCIARVSVSAPGEALRLNDEAAERCSMAYKAPELFNVNSLADINEKTDIWVIF